MEKEGNIEDGNRMKMRKKKKKWSGDEEEEVWLPRKGGQSTLRLLPFNSVPPSYVDTCPC